MYQMTIEDHIKTVAVNSMRFNGPVYDAELDSKRLSYQTTRIFNLMKDGNWRTLSEIASSTGDPQASISAQLRHLRKPRFGAYVVEKKRRGHPKSGLWEYRIFNEKE